MLGCVSQGYRFEAHESYTTVDWSLVYWRL
jgi:hypothetical protein